MIVNITIVDYYNYGNRLQNYAMQNVLSQYDARVLTVADLRPWEGSSLKDFLYNAAKKCYRFVYPSLRNIRFRRSMLFTRKYIRTFPYDMPRLLKLLQNRATFVVGSDQVWNPEFDHLSVMDTLSFLQDRRGFSYAASFGVDELPEEYGPRLAEIGRRFKAVSVREESGKKLLTPYVNDVQVHADPTLLLTAEEWEAVMKKPRRFSAKRYIALYFLGERDGEERAQIERFAKENGLEIVDLMDKSSVYFSYGPDEFLWVLCHAEAVFTDSFHGCVFSFLFDKPFVVYDRKSKWKSMASRMETFLPQFCLEERAYTGSLPEDLLCHDYTAGQKVLAQERRRSLDYIKQCLS